MLNSLSKLYPLTESYLQTPDTHFIQLTNLPLPSTRPAPSTRQHSGMPGPEGFSQRFLRWQSRGQRLVCCSGQVLEDGYKRTGGLVSYT